MTLAQIVNATKSYGGKKILNNINLQINQGEKTAIIGPNGSGKTTLLKILTGEITPDSGYRSVTGNTHITYVAQLATDVAKLDVENFALLQHPVLGSIKKKLLDFEEKMNQNKDINYDEYMQALDLFEQKGGYVFLPKVGEIIEKMGVPFKPDVLIDNLSQGEKKLIQLGASISTDPDVIILDEPTNDVDATASEIIDSLIMNSQKTIIYSTHDRYLLNRVAENILELGTGTNKFKGTYDEFVDFKRNSFEADMNKYKAEQKKKEQLRSTMLKMKSIGQSGYDKPAKVAKNLERRIDTLDMQKPSEIKKAIKVGFTHEERGSNIVLKTKDVSVAYDDIILEDININLQKGNKVGLVGGNGSGKTSLLNCLVGYNKVFSGEIYQGPSIQVGYISQNNINLDPNKTVYDFLIDAGSSGRNNIHGLMKKWRFDDNDIEKKISVLSGGEQKKLALMKIMLQKPNFLILDEPTDHLDMVSREGLEKALIDYTGTLLVVSHDRYFLDVVTDKTLAISEGRIHEFEGSYSDNQLNITNLHHKS